MIKYTFNQNILTLFMYILEIKEVDFDSYREMYGIQRINTSEEKKHRYTDEQIFLYSLNKINTIFYDLKIRVQVIKDIEIKKYYYVFNKTKLEFDINELKIEKRKEYRLIIVYLHLLKYYKINIKTINHLLNYNISKTNFEKIRLQINEVI